MRDDAGQYREPHPLETEAQQFRRILVHGRGRVETNERVLAIFLASLHAKAIPSSITELFMEKLLPLSVFVVTKNEAENIRVCLGSLAGLAAEIIVVDSGSTDGTPAIAGKFGAKVIHQEWLGFRDQKAFALKQCSQPWVLSLDSDEAVSPEMRQSILQFFDEMHERQNGVIFNRKVRFLGKWITHGDWYPDRKLRLFRRDRGRLIGDATHDAFGVDGSVCTMPGDILHNSYPDIRSYIDKINRYADGHLRASIEQKKKWCLSENLFRPFWRFFRAYVLRLGFLDGFAGLWIAVATAFAAFVRYSRLYEHEKVQTEIDSSP